jgi:RHH-type rel operon transcriptional repressor/antitoxin RelB
MIRISAELEARLTAVANLEGRTVEACAEQAIRGFLEDQEDYRVALQRLRDRRPGIPLEQIKRELELAD